MIFKIVGVFLAFANMAGLFTFMNLLTHAKNKPDRVAYTVSICVEILMIWFIVMALFRIR